MNQPRFGDWIPILLGFVSICVLVNTLAVVFLYLHFDKTLDRLLDERVAADRLPSTSEAVPGVRRDEEPPKASIEEPQAASTTTEVEPAAPANTAIASPDVTAAELPGRQKVEPEAAPLSAEEIVARVRQSDRVDAGESEAEKVEPSPKVTGLFPDDVPLFRLLLLEQAGGGVDWFVSFLLDPDEQVRSRAIEKIRSQGDDEVPSPALLAALRSVPVADQPFAQFRRTLDELFPAAAESLPAGEPATSVEAALREVRGSARSYLRRAPVQALRTELQRMHGAGLEIVFIIDVSRSMKDKLQHVVGQIQQLWSVLRWGFPGVRLGTLLYHDEIVSSSGFATQQSDQLLPAPSGLAASGGGDVPERIDLALKHALSLGAFRWRPASVKHLVVLGDAPPHYSEQEGLLSLVRGAHQQANYQVHAFYLEANGEDFEFFSRLAAAGGGRAHQVEPRQLGATVLSSFAPRSAVPLVLDFWPQLSP